MNKTCSAIVGRTKPNDVFYTPIEVVEQMIELSDITPDMKVLDPCKGNGRFYDNLPECNKDWCEIADNKDFFEYNDRVDLVIGNPPFSIWTKWLEHTVKITDKFCYIMGSMNLTDVRIRMLEEKGYGITKIHMVKIDWWFGMSLCIVAEKGAKSIITAAPRRVYFGDCGKRCGIGKKGNSPNVCGLIQD